MAKKSAGLFDWAKRLETIPMEPGVYLMKDREEQIVYIGKAKNLKRRVRQYFQEGSDTRPFVRRLPRLLHQIEVILTNTEREALLFEATLILKHQPRFNILLKEEKRYLYLRLDCSHPYPRLETIRKSRKDRKKGPQPKERLYGPYLSGYIVRELVKVIDQHFLLRTCDDREMRNRVRPCMEYQIRRCDAPCCLSVSREDYTKRVEEVGLFLDGKHQVLLDDLEKRMQEASEKWAFEVAAKYRDQAGAIQKLTTAKQVVEREEHFDYDVLGFYREGDLVEIQRLVLRHGTLMGGRSFSFREQMFEASETLENFVTAYYLREGVEFPHQILLPFAIDGAREIEAVLTERAGRQVHFHVPVKGDKKRMIEMATKNAEQGFLEKQKTEDDAQKLLLALQKRLGLKRLPYRIECIDNSHMQGRSPVSAIVVFEGGYPNRSAYRRYHIKEAPKGDDYAAMKEILTRRFRRGVKTGELPDLLLVDGGKGQLKIALSALSDLGLDGVEVAAIAKKRMDGEDISLPNKVSTREEKPQDQDRILLPDRKNPIPVTGRHRELLLLSRLRDEAHKTAVTFHQKTRERGKLQSVLDEIPSIGSKRKQALLKHLGSVQRIGQASIEQLTEVPSMSLAAAEEVLSFFAKKNKKPRITHKF